MSDKLRKEDVNERARRIAAAYRILFDLAKKCEERKADDRQKEAAKQST